ncbi:hypothetical protein TNCV_3690761 [Trichonephila clavipes]|nr:hypothetical protein TNCV_3690761 [Trichonephila clavipes]
MLGGTEGGSSTFSTEVSLWKIVLEMKLSSHVSRWHWFKLYFHEPYRTATQAPTVKELLESEDTCEWIGWRATMIQIQVNISGMPSKNALRHNCILWRTDTDAH